MLALSAVQLHEPGPLCMRKSQSCIPAQPQLARQGTAAALATVMCVCVSQAMLSSGWDVVTADDCLLTNYSWALLSGQNGMQPHAKRLGHRFSLSKGQLLQAKDASCRQFFVLIEVCSILVPVLCLTPAIAIHILRSTVHEEAADMHQGMCEVSEGAVMHCVSCYAPLNLLDAMSSGDAAASRRCSLCADFCISSIWQAVLCGPI